MGSFGAMHGSGGVEEMGDVARREDWGPETESRSGRTFGSSVRGSEGDAAAEQLAGGGAGVEGRERGLGGSTDGPSAACSGEEGRAGRPSPAVTVQGGEESGGGLTRVNGNDSMRTDGFEVAGGTTAPDAAGKQHDTEATGGDGMIADPHGTPSGSPVAAPSSLAAPARLHAQVDALPSEATAAAVWEAACHLNGGKTEGEGGENDAGAERGARQHVAGAGGCSGGSAGLPLDASGRLPFFFLDAVEETQGAMKGTVFLFGKVRGGIQVLLVVPLVMLRSAVDRVTCIAMDGVTSQVPIHPVHASFPGLKGVSFLCVSSLIAASSPGLC